MSDEEKTKMENSVEEAVDSNGSLGSWDDSPPIPRRIFLEKEETVRRPGSFWKRPPTKVYADNFGFGVNGYQPMIDYLDRKDTGESANKSDVHLPYSEERCMNKYSASKPFKLYNNLDIDKYIAKGEKIRTQIRQNDAAGASNVLRRTHTNWSMTKKYVQLVKNSYVVDYRKLHSEDNGHKDVSENRRPLSDGFIDAPKYCYRVLTVIPESRPAPDMETSALFGTYIRNRLDHENSMAQRRERLRALDDQYEESIQRLSNTVDRINQRERSLPASVISPCGNVYTSDEVMRVADDMIYSNRLKRQQDLHRLESSVDSLTDAGRKYRGYQPRNAIQFLGDEVCGINSTAVAIAKCNAVKAAIASRSAAGLMDFDDDKVDRRIKDIRRRNETMQVMDGVSYLPQTRRRVVHDDVISDVQDRVMNRAREMAGETSETRRIRNRAKFMNTVSPRPDTGACDLRVPPSRTERNIVYMSKSLAHGGGAQRKYTVDDETDEPVSTLGTNYIRNYCSQETSRPIPQVPSDSSRVRNAENRARTRNTLLGN